jgi:hypothetical protein
MPVKGLTQAEIDEATRAQVASGAKSTDRANRLPGETASEANARITAAYKEMTAKPILSAEQQAAGAEVKFVRTGAGGVGENMVIVPLTYDGPPIKVTEFTPGVIPANVTRTTGTSVGFNPDDYKTAEDAQRIAAKIAAGGALTADEQAFLAKGVAPTAAPTATSEPIADAATAVRKLQSGQALTDAEKKLLGISVTTAAAPTGTPAPKKFTPAELQAIIRKLTSGQKLTPEEAAAVGVSDPNSITAPVAPTGPTGTGPTGTGPTGTTPTGTTPTGTTPTGTKPTGTTPTGTTPTGTTPTGTTPTGTTPTGTTPTGTTPTGTTPTGTTPTGTTATGTATLSVTSTLTTPSALTYKASDGTVFTDQAAYVAYQKMLNDNKAATAATSAENAKNRQSAYDLLYAEFSKYGLGALVQPLQGLIQSGASPAEFSIKLRESEPYKERFKGNSQRIAKGLKAISEAEYIGLEDQYQEILRNAGLPDSYWKQSVDPRTGITTQEGFTNFIANDVSAVELEDRVNTAQQRLIYANPEVSIALKTFYPDITNGDLLAYALDPTKGLEQIKRRITAAEIGSSAVQMGLATNVTDAEYLARYGVTKAAAQQGYRTAADILPTATKLSDIYSTQVASPYTQQTAEQEIFNVPGASEAAAKRKKLAGLEQAQFSGRSGLTQGALARERAGNF